MTYEELLTQLKEDVLRMKHYNDQITAINNVLEVDLYEGFVGEMMDQLFYYILEPYAGIAGKENEDEALEGLWHLIFNEDDIDDAINEFGFTFLHKEYE